MADKAEKKEELDLDVQPKSGGKKKLILIAGIGGLVLALGAGGAFFLLKGKDEEHAEEAAAPAVAETHYLPIDKLIVNFGQGSPVRFLQVNIQLMAHDGEAIKAVETHMPAIRNDILLLLGARTYQEVNTPAGKEALRTAILETVQKVLDTHAHGKRIDAVYYTEFVMQ